MSKKTPKRSKMNKNEEMKENIAIAIAFVLFMAILGSLFYYMGFPKAGKDLVATIDGKDITTEELDWWYKTSILPEYWDSISKKAFLENSLIPQEVLLHEAEKQDISVSPEEVEKDLGIYAIDNGLTMEGFEENLGSRGISLDEIKNSFKVRASITKLLEKEGMQYSNKGEDSENDQKFQSYLNGLINNSKIIRFKENIDKIVLKDFEEANNKACSEKPIAVLFTTAKCQQCNDTALIFENDIKGFVEEGSINASLWILDTGDNALTPEKESGIPKDALELFKSQSPSMLVPVTVVGCKYKRIGSLNKENEYEFKSILNGIVNHVDPKGVENE